MKAVTIIGWREWVSLPEFGVPYIKAKIDTGAKTSAIHAYRIKQTTHEGAPWVRFFVHPLQDFRKPEFACEAPLVDARPIRSSNGKVETRLTVRTALKFGMHRFSIELTLANRDEMGFRMLIGRRALRYRFFVDSATSFALGDIDEPYPSDTGVKI